MNIIKYHDRDGNEFTFWFVIYPDLFLLSVVDDVLNGTQF